MSKTFIWSGILTLMDGLVFILCVDKGLTPVTIVGACYIALRCFSKDAQDATNLIGPAIKKAEEWLGKMKVKMKERKEVEEPEEEK